jgi:hypothetical protein
MHLLFHIFNLFIDVIRTKQIAHIFNNWLYAEYFTVIVCKIPQNTPQ